MSERFITLKALVAGAFRMEPPNCTRNFGDSKCQKKVNGGKCPTRVLETDECGGWAPRGGKLPLKSLLTKD